MMILLSIMCIVCEAVSRSVLQIWIRKYGYIDFMDVIMWIRPRKKNHSDNCTGGLL